MTIGCAIAIGVGISYTAAALTRSDLRGIVRAAVVAIGCTVVVTICIGHTAST